MSSQLRSQPLSGNGTPPPVTRGAAIGGVVLAGLILAAPVLYYRYHETHRRNFRVVADGVLYRSGQLTPQGLEAVVRECGIRTVISLRAAGSSDGWEEAFCAARNIRHVRIAPRIWAADEHGEIPARQAVDEFLRVMDDPRHYPVLVHCYAGIHRTGTMTAIFRMEYQGWSLSRALAEMFYCGYDPADLEADVDSFLRHYRPRRSALQAGPGGSDPSP